MLKYDISKMATPTTRRKRRVVMGAIESPLGLEKQYEKELRALIRLVFNAIKADVLPVVEKEIATKRAEIRDAIEESVFEQLYGFVSYLLRSRARNMVGRILNLTSKRNQKTFMASAKKTLGIDLSAVVREADMEDLLANAALQNAGLIKNLLDTMINRVQIKVVNAVLVGQSASSLQKELAAELGIANKRAKIIARDQISKVNAALTEARHLQAGIKSYEWSTSQDERVRPLHRNINGRVYEYGKPTDAEQGLPPGQPILCRCVARPIVEF